MKQFQITLKNEKIRLYTLLSWLIIVSNLILFLYLYFFSTSRVVRYTSIAALAIFVILFILQFYFRRSKYAFGFTPFFLIVMLAWINTGNYFLAAVTVVFELLSFYSLRKQVIIISKDIIFYPSFPPKKILWNKLNNIILKDSILTIDLKNNKIIQQLIDETQIVINEKEFNEFCRQQLKDAGASV